MVRMSRFGIITTAIVLAILTVRFVHESEIQAQSTKTKPRTGKPLSPTEAKQIDARLEKLQETFATESTAIVDGYERSGQFERAKLLLEVLLKLDPKNESVKNRLTELDEKILERTELEQKLNAGADWTLVGTVQKDKPARVEAAGEYKMTLSATTLSADGFAQEDVMHDMAPRVPLGALMGMIVTEANQKEKKPPEPFAIKSKHDFTPKQDGQLYLKVNVPPGAKCVGDLRIKLNGVVRGT